MQLYGYSYLMSNSTSSTVVSVRLFWQQEPQTPHNHGRISNITDQPLYQRLLSSTRSKLINTIIWFNWRWGLTQTVMKEKGIMSIKEECLKHTFLESCMSCVIYIVQLITYIQIKHK